MTIWKYTLDIADRQIRSMPVGATILNVEMQQNWPRIWALVDPRAPEEDRCFTVIGTGDVVPRNGTYHGTVLDGSFVWHIFETSVPE